MPPGGGLRRVAVVSFGCSWDQEDAARRLPVTVLAVAWGLRLAVRIARRGRGHGEDPRYEAVPARARGNRNPYTLRMIHLLRGAPVGLVSLPVQAARYTPRPLSAPAFVGTAVRAVGLFFEAVGDAQPARFRADPVNRGRIVDRDPWRLTRHPNHFGDFLVRWGLFLVACDGGWQAAVVSVVSPLVVGLLLINGSGKRLPEGHMAGRPGWDAYAARASGSLPGRRAGADSRVGCPARRAGHPTRALTPARRAGRPASTSAASIHRPAPP
ncbi:DUF1295 domain-containing protein [Streptomyces somaliensis]|uniref:DUF1295 domain-containing protein n=1 Tax=Streptomyces somaliensis TaxID=78355 RepID=UPI0027E3ED57|nr:DUF1295 domain-containing protein [Streptomyces somaliensis]